MRSAGQGSAWRWGRRRAIWIFGTDADAVEFLEEGGGVGFEVVVLGGEGEAGVERGGCRG